MPLPMQVFDSVWPIKRRARCISWQRGMKVTPMSRKLQRLYESRLDANLDRPVSAGISWGLTMDKLKGKGTVVTGAASRIGKAIAKTGEVADMSTKEHTTIFEAQESGGSQSWRRRCCLPSSFSQQRPVDRRLASNRAAA